MQDLYNFVGEDSRTPIERLRRSQLWRIADAVKLKYPQAASKEAMIKLFEANNIDVTQCPEVQWAIFHGKDSEGQPRQEMYPVQDVHASERNGVNAALALQERLDEEAEEQKAFEDARIDVLERENAQLRRTNEQQQEAFEKRLAALEGKAEKPVNKHSPQSKYWAAYGKAKKMGLAVERGMKLPQIEALIEEANG